MSVLIRGMKMPKDCGHCKCRYISNAGQLICRILSKEVKMQKFGKRPKNCPLIEVDIVAQEELITPLNMIGGYLEKAEGSDNG